MIAEDNQYYFKLRDSKGKDLATGKKISSITERNKSLPECFKYIQNGKHTQSIRKK